MFALKEIPADEMHFDLILSGLLQGQGMMIDVSGINIQKTFQKLTFNLLLQQTFHVGERGTLFRKIDMLMLKLLTICPQMMLNI